MNIDLVYKIKPTKPTKQTKLTTPTKPTKSTPTQTPLPLFYLFKLHIT